MHWQHTHSYLFVSPIQLLETFLENIKRGMAQHPQLALPNYPNQDIGSYYEVL